MVGRSGVVGLICDLFARFVPDPMSSWFWVALCGVLYLFYSLNG